MLFVLLVDGYLQKKKAGDQVGDIDMVSDSIDSF